MARHPEIEVVGEKVDDGYSGLLFDRPAFVEMMDAIYQGEANCIITKDFSRLGREYIEMGTYLRRIFPACGVRFIAISDNFDTLTDDSDDLSVSVRVAHNDSYARDSSKRTRDALKAKRKIGDYVGACPIYGYKKDENNRNLLVIDEYPASVVRDIFRMKIEGASAVRIADSLNELGVLSPMEYKKYHGLPHPKKCYSDVDDGKWSATTIFRILKNETYTGTLIQGIMGKPNYKVKAMLMKPPSEWQRVENTHEAIIPDYVYDLVQKVLLLDTRTSPNSDIVYTFSGILICGCCGNRMTRKIIYNRDKTITYYYYFCPTGKKKGCHLGATIKEDDLKLCVLQSVKAHIFNISQVENLLAELDANVLAKALAKKLTTQLNENKQRIIKIHGYKAGLYESMIEEDLTHKEYTSLKAKYTSDAAALSLANDRIEREIDDILSCRHEHLAWVKRFKEFENIELIDRKTVVCLIHSIRIHSKSDIEITFDHQEDFETALEILQKEAV